MKDSITGGNVMNQFLTCYKIVTNSFCPVDQTLIIKFYVIANT